MICDILSGSTASTDKMSLYANIPVSEIQAKAAAAGTTPKANPKSAALYAGVLAQQTRPAERTPIVIPDEISRPLDLDTEKTEASGISLSFGVNKALQFKPTIRRIAKPARAKGPVATHTSNPVTVAAPATSKPFLQDVSKIQEDIANDDVNGFYRTLEGQRLARRNNRKK